MTNSHAQLANSSYGVAVKHCLGPTTLASHIVAHRLLFTRVEIQEQRLIVSTTDIKTAAV